MFTICGSVPVSTQFFFFLIISCTHLSFLYFPLEITVYAPGATTKLSRSRSVVAAFSSARANGLPKSRSKILVSHSRVESLLLLSCPDVTLEMTVFISSYEFIAFILYSSL